jgi:hypothetical protein
LHSKALDFGPVPWLTVGVSCAIIAVDLRQTLPTGGQQRVNAKADPLLDGLLWETGIPPGGGGSSPPLPVVPTRQDAIRKISFTHDALIDMIIARPELSQGAIAAHFGYTQSWLSQIMSSDSFKKRLAERRDALVDPILRLEVEERFKAVVERSMTILMEKLSVPASQVPDQLALRALEIGSRAAGYGARQSQPPVEVNVDIHLNNLAGRLDNLLTRKRREAERTAIDGTCEESPSED